MEIEDPSTSQYLPLPGGTNFQHERGVGGLLDSFHFNMNWTKGGLGEELLHDVVRAQGVVKVRWHGKEYKGRNTFEAGFNTSAGIVMFEVVP